MSRFPARLRRRDVRRGAIDVGVTVILIAAWWVLLSPVTLGGNAAFVIVHGQSMQPQYSSGDLVVARTASEYRIDDVVVFRAPDRRGYVIHRIVGGDASTGWTTRGDGNTRSDRWTVPDEAIVGREWLVIPRIARSVATVQRSPIRFAAAVGIAVTSLMLLVAPGPEERRSTNIVDGTPAPSVTSVARSESDVHSSEPHARDLRSSAAQESPTGFDAILARLDVMLGELSGID